jgi:hypothetical protein
MNKIEAKSRKENTEGVEERISGLISRHPDLLCLAASLLRNPPHHPSHHPRPSPS